MGIFPTSSKNTKPIIILTIATCAFVLFLTKSRGPILSTMVSICLISSLRKSRSDLTLITSLAGIAAISEIFSNAISTSINRFYEPNYRSAIWAESLTLIIANPVFGQGSGQLVSIPFLANGNELFVGHSHSSFLEAFRTGGLIGGLLFLWLIANGLRRSFTLSNDRGFFAVWLIYGLLCLSTNGRSVFIRPSIEWFCFWLPLLFCYFLPVSYDHDKTK